MIGRRGLLGIGPLLAAPAMAQSYYPRGTKVLPIRFSGSSGVALAGTLTLPFVSEIQRVPGVVLIAGSGPTDRDGNNPYIPARVDLLKLIAELLAAAGIAALRYDKRGIGSSTTYPLDGLAAQERFVAWDDFVGDVRAAHAELLRHDEIKSYATAFLGHSEGGLLALAAAAAMGKQRPHCVVLAGTPGRTLREIVSEQIARISTALVDQAERAMSATIETGHVPAGLTTPLALFFPAYTGPFLRQALTFNPATTLANLDCACLLVHGGADSQVVPTHDIQPLIDAMAKRTAPGEVLVAPAVSHNLKPVSGPSDPGFAGPLAPAIADKLERWLGYTLGA